MTTPAVVFLAVVALVGLTTAGSSSVKVDGTDTTRERLAVAVAVAVVVHVVSEMPDITLQSATA